MGFGVFARIEDGHNAGMREPPRGLCFLRKSLPVFFFAARILPRERYGFDCDGTTDFRVKRAIHHSHRATADFGLDLVTPERLVRQSFHT